VSVFQISQHQLDALRISGLQGFAQRAVVYARQTLGGLRQYDDAELMQRLDAVKSRVNAMNIRAESSIVDVYIECLRHGLRILEDPKTAKFLQDVNANEFVRVRRFVSEFHDA